MLSFLKVESLVQSHPVGSLASAAWKAISALKPKKTDPRMDMLIRNAVELAFVNFEMWDRRLLAMNKSHYRALLNQAERNVDWILTGITVQAMLPAFQDLFPVNFSLGDFKPTGESVAAVKDSVSRLQSTIVQDPADFAQWVVETAIDKTVLHDGAKNIGKVSEGAKGDVTGVLAVLVAQRGKGQRHSLECQHCKVQIIGDRYKCQQCYEVRGLKNGDTAFCRVCVMDKECGCIRCGSLSHIRKMSPVVGGDCDYCKFVLTSDLFMSKDAKSGDTKAICGFCFGVWSQDRALFDRTSGFSCNEWRYIPVLEKK
ncbi:hypothetical protein HDU98_003727 [Podochytrium sp. JEL0797]|nr:hypothetical protein HDU98_003727 [Podochytrium sp. JEL0797]